MKRFYSNDISDNCIRLDRDETRHLIKVMRLKIGDRVEVVDGIGNLYSGKVTGIINRIVEISILNRQFIEREPNLIAAAVAITKNSSRFEFFVEKATEIGIDEIIPLITKRTLQSKLKPERLKKIIISAGKQSRRVHFPVLKDTMNIDLLLQRYANLEQKYVAHCEDDQERIELAQAYDANQQTLILIGPEGDFTSEEINLLTANDFKPITLGHNRLRVETAAIYAMSILSNLRNTNV